MIPILVMSVWDVSQVMAHKAKHPLLLRFKRRMNSSQLASNSMLSKISRSYAIAQCNQQHITAGSTIISETLPCFDVVVDSDCEQHNIVCDGAWTSVQASECLLGKHRAC